MLNAALVTAISLLGPGTTEGIHLARLVAEIERLDTMSSEKYPNHPQPSRLLRAQDVAKALGMSTRWVYDNAPWLPFCRRVGRSVRFDSAGLERWIEESEGQGSRPSVSPQVPQRERRDARGRNLVVEEGSHPHEHELSRHRGG